MKYRIRCYLEPTLEKKYPPSPLKCTIDGSQVMGLKLWKWCIYVGT